MEKTFIVTTTEQAKSQFFGDILSAVETGGSKEEKSRLQKEVTQSYAKAKAELRQQIATQVAERRQKFEEDKAALEVQLSQRLEAVEAEYAKLGAKERSTSEKQKAYKDAVSGEKIIIQRATIRLTDEYDLDITKIKQQEALLASAKSQLLCEISGKKYDIAGSMQVSLLNTKAGFNLKRTLKNKAFWLDMLPFIMLVSIILAHLIACNVMNYAFNLDTIITYGIYVAIVAIGGVFIYSQGAFDMSLGPAALMCAAITGLVYNATGNIVVALCVSVVLGIGLGLVNAFLANCLKLPVMVMTLTMMNILSSSFATIAESQKGGYIVVTGISEHNSTVLKWSTLIIFGVLCYVLFNYTKIGRRNKLIGSNATCAKFTGISIMKAGLVSFAISGIGLGLCGFLFTVENAYVNSGTMLDTVGLNVVIAISIGGMPTSGGPRSRISAAIVGAFFIIFLEQLFAAMSLQSYKYLAKGLLFLIVAFVNFYGMRTKRLAQ